MKKVMNKTPNPKTEKSNYDYLAHMEERRLLRTGYEQKPELPKATRAIDGSMIWGFIPA